MTSGRRDARWWLATVALAAAVLCAGGVGIWQVVQAVRGGPADSAEARQVVLDVAKSSTVKLMSYVPETVEAQLTEAARLTTGKYRESFTGLINDVVIPGAKSKSITATATVPAAAVVSLEEESAVLIVFVNQTTAFPGLEPTNAASTVKMKLQKVDGSWLIAELAPI